MKQRITIEQLNKLTDEQKERLRDWWNPQIGDVFLKDNFHLCVSNQEPEPHMVDVICYYDFSYSQKQSGTHKSYCLPLLDIGQMIELLKTNEWNLEILELSGDFRVANDVHNGNAYSREELSDALWEACKSILMESEGK